MTNTRFEQPIYDPLTFTVENLYNGYVTNGRWNEEKYHQYNFARAWFPGYSEWADFQIGKQRNDWYMSRYRMTWNDVKNPWNLPGYSMQASAYSYVSDNVKRLYR